MIKPDLRALLKIAVDRDASDIHISAGEVPALRLNGQIMRLNCGVFSDIEVNELVEQLLTDNQRATLRRNLSVDFPFTFDETVRFRTNVFKQNRGLSIALRKIPTKIRSLKDLDAPHVIQQIADFRQGLILVTGPTGSGKSTTLAAIVHHINLSRSDHIITIEDPIEYIHSSRQALINQREIGVHALHFSDALRAALREDPDVILVGEMRDLETISLAITAAETGHLVLATLHTNSAADSIDRIVDAYPNTEQRSIRNMLSNSLRAVISQTLGMRFDGKGRLAIYECMIVTPAIRNHIRENKSHQIPSTMETARGTGMQTMANAINDAVHKNKISSMEGDRVRTKCGINPQKKTSQLGGARGRIKYR